MFQRNGMHVFVGRSDALLFRWRQFRVDLVRLILGLTVERGSHSERVKMNQALILREWRIAHLPKCAHREPLLVISMKVSGNESNPAP